jgi:hypothetical protein
VKNKGISGRVLDYGCGRGEDCDESNWFGFDPNTDRADHQIPLRGRYDFVLCTYVLNVIPTPQKQDQVIRRLRKRVMPSGRLYVTVRRGIPEHMEGNGQWTVELDAPVVHKTRWYVIYELKASL